STLTLLLSITIVKDESTIELRGSVLKSLDTNGASLTPKIPFIASASYFLNASLISSLVTSLSRSTTRSTNDTFETGTRSAIPSSLPSSSGSTKAVAFAAPVEVGIIFSAAERARRKSLCGLSRFIWSFVYACTVVTRPFLIPNSSFNTFATGARQFVVHDAFENTSYDDVSNVAQLTPRTNVCTFPPDDGPVNNTFLAPASI